MRSEPGPGKQPAKFVCDLVIAEHPAEIVADTGQLLRVELAFCLLAPFADDAAGAVAGSLYMHVCQFLPIGLGETHFIAELGKLGYYRIGAALCWVEGLPIGGL